MADPGGGGHGRSGRRPLHLASGVWVSERALPHHQPQRLPGANSRWGPQTSTCGCRRGKREERGKPGKENVYSSRLLIFNANTANPNCWAVFKGSKMKHDSGTECCLSLCQAVSFLPTAEDDEEMMMRKEEGHGKGRHMHIFFLIVFIIESYLPLALQTALP